jgi:hypothetical protein
MPSASRWRLSSRAGSRRVTSLIAGIWPDKDFHTLEIALRLDRVPRRQAGAA